VAGAVATLEGADRAAARALAPDGHNRLLAIVGQASEVADQPPLIALCAGLCLLGLVRRDRRLAGAGGRMLAAEMVATGLKSVVKHRVDRTRPQVEHRGDAYRAEPGHSEHTDLNSFPSGHTAGAVAVARTLGRAYPRAAGPALALAVGIAAVQVPRGKHYPVDLLAGAAIGLAADWIVAGAFGGVRRLLG
jgi:membrane-associated phospholipid phosphatase